MLKKHSISEETPKNVVLGAGIFVKDLVFENDDWTYTELGATSGGGKVSYSREFLDLDIDGKAVKVVGMDKKVGETAQMTMNLAEYKKETIVSCMSLKEDTTNPIEGFTKYTTKAIVSEEDYMENVGFVGRTADDEPIIVIFDYAICLSALELETKNKEQSSMEIVIDAVAPSTQEDLTYLPIHFYFPTR